MTQSIRYTLLSLRDLLVSVGPFLFLAITLLGLAYWWLNPNPPKHVTLATGPAQSAYATFGQRYAKALAKDGITVELVPTEGSADNLRLLREGSVDLGFVRGGTAEAAELDDANLESLGSLFLEPVWLFYREAAAPSDTTPPQTLDSLTQLQGLRVNVGTPGSGVVDLAANIPSRNLRLVAPTTTLLTREGTHPALVQLFALAGNSIHGGPGWFKHAREFPNVKNNELPLAQEAERSIQGGAPLLQRYLPFWVANLVERMWLALGLILAVLLPLSRVIPPLYAFRIRSRIFRWYARLRELEARAEEAGDTAPLLNELNELDRLAEKISVPLSYTDELYALRNNIQLVRKKLQRSTAR